MHRNSIGLSKSDKFYFFFNDLFLILCFLIVIYPIIYVFSASFSSATAVVTGKVILFPVDFSLDGYKAVFENKNIVSGYLNTIFYTTVGTVCNIIITILAAYPLSRHDMAGRKILMYLFAFTMLFGGGMIPTYILMQNLNLIDNRMVIILPEILSVYNLIICRTFFENSIPESLYEAATIDGCSHFKYLWSIVLPLSKPILAVLVLFYAVAHWNSFFSAFLYLKSRNKFPLQLILREILISSDIGSITDPELLEKKQGLADLLKYASIVVASVPLWCIYPFVQKHFVKGVMIGAVKG